MKQTIEARIRGDIERRIRSGDWRPGERIPFEHELVVQYGCARATVSKALAGLTRAGLIERRRRAGSFIAQPHIQSAALAIPDIGEMIARRGDAYRWELIERRAAGEDDQANAAPLKAKGPMIAIEGLHRAAGLPFGLETRLINLAAVPDAEQADFSREAPGSWLLNHIPWTDARHRISAVAAGAAIAKHLGVTAGTACLQLERWTWRLGVGVTFARQTFPGDRYDLIAEFTPQGE